MYRKIQQVQKVLNDAALHTEKFGKSGGIGCASGCHLCCLKKDIMASPLEFLPLAWHLYKNGTAEAFYDRIEALPENSLCILFSALGERPGGCTAYPYRALICRLFGFSSGIDKSGNKRLITCKTIKESDGYKQLQPVHLGRSPVAADYYMRLVAIDFLLAGEQLQINQALKRALEIVMTHYRYTGKKHPA